MTIDAHQHFWKYNPQRDGWITSEMQAIRRDFGPQDLYPHLKEKSIDGCIAVQADQTEEETRFLLTQAQENAFVMGVVGWADLCGKDISDRLNYFSGFPEIKGFRHIVQSEPDDAFMQRSDFCRGIQALKAHTFTYDILIYPRHLGSALALVKRFPQQLFVVDHLAKPLIREGVIEPWRTEMQELARAENVYCKLSGMVTEANWKSWEQTQFQPYLDVVMEAFGPRRVMYGSDWPVCTVAASYGQQYDIISDYISMLSPSEKAQIMGENAVHFYHI